MSAFDRTLELPHTRELVWDYLMAMLEQDHCQVILTETPRYVVVERSGAYQIYHLQVEDVTMTRLRTVVTTREDVIAHLQQAADLDSALDGLVEKVPFPLWSGAEGRLDRLRHQLWNDFHPEESAVAEPVPVHQEPQHKHFHYPHEGKTRKSRALPMKQQIKHTMRKSPPGGK